MGKSKIALNLESGRLCLTCKQEKSRDSFYKHPTGMNGLGSRCKECIVANYPNRRVSKKQYYDRNKDLGRCVRCASDSMVTSVLCKQCWFKDISYNRAGGRHNHEKLTDLWDKQKGKCFYSEESLTPGDGASIDHQIPVSRGGENDPSNLVWVSTRINLMKTDMTHSEFIRMCKFIASKFDKDGLGS